MPTLHIVIDTREQLPYKFTDMPKGWKVATVRKKLDTGDYSLKGYEDKFCIERKSLSDLFGTIGNKIRRARFSHQLIRMRVMPRSCVVVEAHRDIVQLGPPYYNGKEDILKYAARVYSTTIGWVVKPGIPFYFFRNRKQAESWVIKYLIKMGGLIR